jgi:uncharacterized protein (TIGR00266 family)
MKTEIIGEQAFQSLRVLLQPGETFLSEAGKMVRMSAGVDLDVTTQARSGGGFMAGLKRMVGGESFFFTRYTAEGAPGEIVVAPTLSGNVGLVELDGSGGWMCTGGSYLASGPGVDCQAEWQGMKGLLSGENMVFIRCTGVGPLAMDAFGVIHDQMVEDSLVVDTGHVVAFEDSLDYEITKVGGSWWTSFLSGEGFVIRFKGRGRVMIQSHNRSEFGSVLGPKLPMRS